MYIECGSTLSRCPRTPQCFVPASWPATIGCISHGHACPHEETEGRWAQWGGRPTGPWAPPPSGSTWLSPIGLLCQFKEEYACFPAEERVAPPYIYEGRGSISRYGGDGRSPTSIQATLENPSRCSSSSLVEVLGLEEFGYES